MTTLANCPWKGNIREFANFIERAVIVTRGEELEIPIAALPTVSENVVALTSLFSFRQAESSVIIDALRAAAEEWAEIQLCNLVAQSPRNVDGSVQARSGAGTNRSG